MSLTNPEKVVTEERLAEFYAQILPYLGGMPEIVSNKICKSDLYSSTEKIIGQWTDGKPIYQKTFDFGALPNKTTKSLAHNISNIGTIVGCKAFALSGTGTHTPIPKAHDQNVNYQIQIEVSTSDIVIYSREQDRSNYTGYVTIQYTKSTDSAMAFGTETDYSTDEKIVGTWLDGKFIYQKTIETTLPNVSTNGTFVDKSINISDLHVDKMAEIKAVCHGGASGQFMLPFITNSNYLIKVLYDANNTSLKLYSNTTSYNGVACKITIQYTKTS